MSNGEAEDTPASDVKAAKSTVPDVDGKRTNVEAETAQVEAETTAQVEAETTAQVEAETTVQVEAETTAQVEAETTAQVEAETTAQVEAETTAQVEAETTAQVEAETTAQVEAETTAQVEAETTAQVEAETTAQVEMKTADAGATTTDVDADIVRDFEELGEMKPPVKRAAYSDRTAWLMALLSQIAYTRLEEETESYILGLAGDFVALTDRTEIVERLRHLAGRLRDGLMTDNEALQEILRCGGFELKGVLFDAETDTQGFVAVSKQVTDGNMAVVVFRGTQQTQDWITNLSAVQEELKDGTGVGIANVHRGFHSAFLSVRKQMDRLLEDESDLPVYITGHSLGGALAALATWYTSAHRLAACYTFGAPRVGNDGLTNRFRTPIYRLVNGADPVPFVPPSGIVIDALKFMVRFLATFIGPLEKLVGVLIGLQGYRHYGFQRYLTICRPGDRGDFPGLRNEFGVSSLERIWRQVRRLANGEFTRGVRIDRYHDISLYRTKLRAFAKTRQEYLRPK